MNASTTSTTRIVQLEERQ
ncbi:hypothetical protein ACLKA6_000469, partial [Drosophila palustris]